MSFAQLRGRPGRKTSRRHWSSACRTRRTSRGFYATLNRHVIVEQSVLVHILSTSARVHLSAHGDVWGWRKQQSFCCIGGHRTSRPGGVTPRTALKMAIARKVQSVTGGICRRRIGSAHHRGSSSGCRTIGRRGSRPPYARVAWTPSSATACSRGVPRRHSRLVMRSVRRLI